MMRAVLILCACASVLADLPNDEVDTVINRTSLEEDVGLIVPELVRKYGYPLEEHSVVTSDGYTITMHRIPHGKTTGPCTNSPVVFIMHGLLSSSADFVISGPDKGLGYILADRGYDVWLGNARGTRYSRAHVSKNPDEPGGSFWYFSWDQIGNIDVPTMIDYVLNITSKEQLDYIGHSQGTTAFFVMCSLRHAYNSKIRSMHALAPVAYFKYNTNLLYNALAISVAPLLNVLGPGEFFPNTEIMRMAGQLLCQEQQVTQDICSSIMFLLGGYSPSQLNETMLPVILGHTPAGASSRQFVHYTQLFKSKVFCHYDHGLLKNKIVYGTLTPPLYNLSQVRAPVYLHYSLSDPLANVKDVEKLWGEIGNPVEKFIIPLSSFSHFDFLWGIDAKTLVYDKVIDIMETPGECVISDNDNDENLQM